MSDSEILSTQLRVMQNRAQRTAGTLRNAIYSTAVLTYGKKERKNKDWFEAGITQMEPATSEGCMRASNR